VGVDIADAAPEQGFAIDEAKDLGVSPIRRAANPKMRRE
jgi:hypothetical protein